MARRNRPEDRVAQERQEQLNQHRSLLFEADSGRSALQDSGDQPNIDDK
jgi:hypothetical protein